MCSVKANGSIYIGLIIDKQCKSRATYALPRIHVLCTAEKSIVFKTLTYTGQKATYPPSNGHAIHL